MKFFAAGISFKTAPVGLREQFAVRPDDRAGVGLELKEAFGLSEVVLLWTCNRVEIYGVGQHLKDNVRAMFQRLTSTPLEPGTHLYCCEGDVAVRHLFSVAGGLDSMVIGETQITGQVKNAYTAAHAAGLTGHVLNRLFQKALQTAKEIRTRTTIGRGSSSVGGVAVGHAERVFGGGLNGRQVLVIGAGRMAACCLQHLLKKEAGSVLVANRSYERARAMAAEFNGQAIAFARCVEALSETDIVISSTGSPETVIRRPDVESALRRRSARPLLIIDIAVPRDVEPDVGQLDGVHLHDIDALEATARKTLRHRRRDLALCASIIEQKSAGLRALLGGGPGWSAKAGPVASASWCSPCKTNSRMQCVPSNWRP